MTVWEGLKSKLSSRKAWEIPKQHSSYAPPGVWTNVDNDVTPFNRRTWTIYTIIGFWASDYLSIQSYENPSAALTVGLSWREALVNAIVAMIIIGIPIILNGAIGAHLHTPFAVTVRASFGYYFANFAIVTRLITACFWHCIQTWSGSLCFYGLIGAIWPSFFNIPNTIAASAGVTSPQLVAHFVFWIVQFPFMLISPHKLKWFFIFKTVVVVACLIGMAAGLSKMSDGAGDIWDLHPTLTGSEKSWLQLSLVMLSIGGWASLATNICDFTRYMKDGSKGQYVQVAVIPAWSVFVTMLAIVISSAGKIVYGKYIWAPTDFVDYWIPTGSKGRAASAFLCISWAIAQIGTNLSANVISAANDLTALFPRYLNIRRSSVIVTIVGGWVMVPWKIVYSAGSLITFMAGVSLFLAPIFTIMITDYWLIKKRNINVPELYNPKGIYSYNYGCNWRAVIAFLCSLVPNLPGLASSVNPGIKLSSGGEKLADISFLYGFASAFTVYYGLNYFFPHNESLISETVLGQDDIEFYEGEEPRSVEEMTVSLEGEKQFNK